MKIDWKRKLTSRKFWAAVCGFVSMVIMALGKDASTAQTVTGMIMAAASLIAYMIGEGLADSKPDAPDELGDREDAEYTPMFRGTKGAKADDECEECMIHYEDNEWRGDND